MERDPKLIGNGSSVATQAARYSGVVGSGGGGQEGRAECAATSAVNISAAARELGVVGSGGASSTGLLAPNSMTILTCSCKPTVEPWK